jgi:hypothetical protein
MREGREVARKGREGKDDGGAGWNRMRGGGEARGWNRAPPSGDSDQGRLTAFSTDQAEKFVFGTGCAGSW